MKKSTYPRYFPKELEAKWNKKWEEEGLYELNEDKATLSPSSSFQGKYYVLVELPYPSGDLHIGHWFTFVTPDVLARCKRMKGERVFFPMGYDAFGLPAENAAIKRHVHPKDWTMSNIKAMTKQFQSMGTMIDWGTPEPEKGVGRSTTITCLPEYYKWNQWIFLKMYEKGVAYRSKTLSNWCPVDQTVLANEHVEDGKCWRCGSEVIQKEVAQWFLRITEYADKLLWEDTKGKNSNGVDWPQSVKEGQNNWIGKSEGAEIEFTVLDSSKDSLEQYSSSEVEKLQSIKVFTTRPDTLHGATFMVVSPEHEILKQVQDDKVTQYIAAASKKTELERKENKEKTGVFSGLYAINPSNGEKLPIWVADYVLAGYGTGAIMAVPAHDERDFAFAKKFDLPIKQVILRPNEVRGEVLDSALPYSNNMEEPYIGPGTLINSGDWNGWYMKDEMGKVISYLEEKGLGTKKVQYHLHDWSISRQRYWGTPVPMIHCEKCGIVPVPEKDLPVELPYDVDYTPQGKPPLASNESWYKTTCPTCGGEATRDAETLDTFFDSSWYYYRYVNPHYDKAPFDPEKTKQLLPVDIYFGGAEHTLGHTLYARFFTKFFKDLGLIDFDEFALMRIQHGIVLGSDGEKMSKSKGNVINPDDVVKEYGTDAVRLYLSFMMPYEATGPWSTTAMSGMFRFLRRIWDLQAKLEDTHGSQDGVSQISENLSSSQRKSLHMMHKTIKKVGQDIEAIKLNTAVAAIMEWLNFLGAKADGESGKITREEYLTLLQLLAPFAPYITEELWQKMSTDYGLQTTVDKWSIHQQPFPTYDETYLVEDTITIVVQVNGKLRENLSVGKELSTSQKDVEALAKASEKVKNHLKDKEIRKVIFVAGKLINFVV